MSYSPITTDEIAVGAPVANQTKAIIKANFDDQESRLQTVEAATSAFPPILFRVSGGYRVYTGITKTMVGGFSGRITGARLLLDQAGTSGFTEIDVLRKRGGGSYESIFASKPKIEYTAGSDALSNNQTIDPTKNDIQDSDILRLDVTGAQVAASGFTVRLDYVLE